MKYDFQDIEKRWQAYWAKHQTFHVPNPGQDGFDPNKPKFFVLDMFPYPSGVGLHVGHPLGYIATDIVARYKRMTGHAVLHPMGYDAFGLPAEQFAVEHNVHPAVTTEKNIANMTRQLKELGLSYDWDRCFATTDPGYYRWTQWIFLQLFNSWFDPAQNIARPIDELVQRLASEQLYIGLDGDIVEAGEGEGLDAIAGTPIGARKWHELSEQDQRDVLDDHRLAYVADADVNWCPALGTVLANEEVTQDGRSERGNYPVYKRPGADQCQQGNASRKHLDCAVKRHDRIRLLLTPLPGPAHDCGTPSIRQTRKNPSRSSPHAARRSRPVRTISLDRRPNAGPGYSR